MRRQRVQSAGPRLRSELPRWPITAMFVPFPLWWVLGIAEMAWVPIAGLMILLMVRRGGIRAPRGFGIWLLFLVLMLISVIGLDSPGRLIGFVYRVLQYVAVSGAFLYVYNARRTVTVSYLLAMMTVLWVCVVAGGWLGVVAPLFSFQTPLGYVLPQGLQANEVIGEMVVRRSTQWNPDSWLQVGARPSAPFLYTNAWGMVYSLTLPLVIAYLMRIPRTAKFWGLIAVMGLSFVPAALTLNRGMFIGLGVAALYIGMRLFAAGRLKSLAALGFVGVAAVLASSAFGVWDGLLHRLDESSTTENRADLYVETITRTLQAPLFGYGAPRPSYQAGMPSAGTQGHVWTIMFSHGIPALVLFLVFLAMLARGTRAWQDGRRLAIHTVQVVMMIEVFYYGVMIEGLMLTFLVAAAVMAERDRPPRQEVT